MKKSEKGYFLFRKKKVSIEIITNKRIHFSVKGTKENHDVIYYKDKKIWSCDCKYFSLKQKECSHIYAAKKLLQLLQIK